MNYIIHDQNTDYQIKENEDLLELKKIIKDNKVQVLKCENIWHRNNDGPRGPVGCLGDRGPRGCTGPTGATGYTSSSMLPSPYDEKSFRPHLDPKITAVHITFTVPTFIAKEFPNHVLDLTKNQYGQTYEPWLINEDKSWVSYTKGVYKKSGFDELYKSMQVFKPNLTEEAFAKPNGYWDTDLVDISIKIPS